MKRLSVLAAVAILACGAVALVRPAVAQQDQVQPPNGDGDAKQPASGPYVWPHHVAGASGIRPLSPGYRIRSADGQPVRAAADADAHSKSKGDGEEIEPTLQAPQKQWTATPFRLTPSGNGDSSTSDSTTTTP